VFDGDCMCLVNEYVISVRWLEWAINLLIYLVIFKDNINLSLFYNIAYKCSYLSAYINYLSPNKNKYYDNLETLTTKPNASKPLTSTIKKSHKKKINITFNIKNI
jgi:hypothetical protein